MRIRLLLWSFVAVALVSLALIGAASALEVGQKAPDFTLRDSNGQPLSLVQLFAAAPADPDVPTKAVLLIFYRGYW